MKYRARYYVLLAFLWLLGYLLLRHNVYPFGDDISKVFSFRQIPYPALHVWIPNRVVDAFFTHFLFNLYARIYGLFFSVGKPQSLMPLFQTFFSASFATIFVGYIALFRTTVSKLIPDSGYFIFATVVVSSSFILYFEPAQSLTNLFSYSLTALLTLAFLIKVFPIHGLYQDPKDSRLQKPVSQLTFIALSLNAYLVAVGLEIFLVFSWIYILGYCLALYLSERFSGGRIEAFQAVGNVLKPRCGLLIQFAGFSGWALYALTTGGRAKHGAVGSIWDVSAIHYSALLHHYWQLQGLIVVVALCMVMIIAEVAIRRLGFREVRWKGAKKSWTINMLPVAVFTLVLSAGYGLALALLSDLTHDSYIVWDRMIFPLLFVLLVLGFVITARVLTQVRSQTLVGVATVFMMVGTLGSLDHAIRRGWNRMHTAKKITAALNSAASAHGDVVKIDFQLPHRYSNNEGYPLLPGKHATKVYRREYRHALNRFDGTHFSKSGPVFITKKKQHKGDAKG